MFGKKEKTVKPKKPIYKRGWFIALVVMVVLGALLGGGNEDDSAPEIVEIEETSLVSYEIVEKGDISFGSVVRPAWHVVVKEEASRDELEKVAMEVVEKAKNEVNFNAFVAFFYDYPEYIDRGMTLGKVQFAPGGDWSKADTVNPGEFSKMDFNFELKEKDWSKQLSEDEVKVFFTYKTIFDELLEEVDFPDEEEVIEMVAAELDMDADTVNEILLKQVMWMMNNSTN